VVTNPAVWPRLPRRKSPLDSRFEDLPRADFATDRGMVVRHE
jgi:hypothetical protein